MPPSVYRKYFGDSRAIKAQAAGDPLGFSTPLYSEMVAARALLMTHEEYKKLPRKERYKQYIFQIMASEKEAHAYEKARMAAEKPQKKELFERFRR